MLDFVPVASSLTSLSAAFASMLGLVEEPDILPNAEAHYSHRRLTCDVLPIYLPSALSLPHAGSCGLCCACRPSCARIGATGA